MVAPPERPVAVYPANLRKRSPGGPPSHQAAAAGSRPTSPNRGERRRRLSGRPCPHLSTRRQEIELAPSRGGYSANGPADLGTAALLQRRSPSSGERADDASRRRNWARILAATRARDRVGETGQCDEPAPVIPVAWRPRATLNSWETMRELRIAQDASLWAPKSRAVTTRPVRSTWVLDPALAHAPEVEA